MVKGQALKGSQHPRVAKGKPEQFARPVNSRAHQSLRHWKSPENLTFARGQWAVASRNDPRRGPLEQIQLADLWLNSRHELDRRRTRPHHRNATLGKIKLVIPASRVE